jgi:hypothetical protein
MPESTPTVANRESRSKIWLIAGLIIIGVVILTIWLVGFKSIFKILSVLAIILFALAILGLLIYLLWELFFKKHQIDVVYLNFKKLVEAGIRNKPDYLQNLVLSGDKGHTRVTWGRIIGYCRIQVLTEQTEMDENGFVVYIRNPRTGKSEPKTIIVKEEQDVFITEKRGFPFNIFTEPECVRVHPLDHDELIGDVTLKGFSLLKVAEYWFLHSEYMRVDKIDKSILGEAKRSVAFLILSDMKDIVDKAILLDSSHQKNLEQKNLMDLPIPPSQIQPPAP